MNYKLSWIPGPLILNKTLEIIENRKCDSKLRYNFTIKNANSNEINKHFLNEKKLIQTFQIALDKLDSKSASNLARLLFPKEGFESFRVEMSILLKKKEILSLFKDDKKSTQVKNGFSFSVCLTEGKKYKKVSLEELKEKVELNENDEEIIEIKVTIYLFCF